MNHELIAKPALEAEVAPVGSSILWTRDDGQISVQSYRPESDLQLQPHTYSEYAVVYCLEGEITKSQLGLTEIVGRGEAIFSNQGVEHSSSYRSVNGKRCDAVVMSFDRRVLKM